MSMQIPDYGAFAAMPTGARRQSIEMIRRFAGQHAATLFLQVYQFDPDADLRELARQELAKHGITPPTDPTPMTGRTSAGASAPSNADFASFGGTDSAFGFSAVQADEGAAAQDITGGSGRPVQRGPQLANVFTLYRRNTKYLSGERNHIPHNLLGYVLTIGILIGTFAIIAGAFRAFPDISNSSGFTLDAVLVFVGAIFAAIILGAVAIYVWNRRRDRRYESQGQLLLGQTLRASGGWHSGSEGGRSFDVTVHYRVRMPDGTVLDHKANATRNDLSRGGLPSPGDPVAVLAIDRDHLRLL